MNDLAQARPRVAPARAETFHHDGLAISRRVHGDLPRDAPLVVLVHGAMDRSASFGRVMRRLPEYEVIAYDRRGYGGSRASSTGDDVRPPGGGGTIADHGMDLLGVIDFALEQSPLGGGERDIVLIGHSLGGTVCMWAAASDANPAAAMGVYESPAPWLDDSYLSVGGGTVEHAARHGNAAGAEFFYRMMIGEETFARLRSSDIIDRRADGDALIAELRSLRDPLQAFDLTRIHIPVIVGRGELSSRAMTRNAALVSDAIDTAVDVTIPAAAHGAHLSRPDAFADYVRSCVALVRTEGPEGSGDV